MKNKPAAQDRSESDAPTALSENVRAAITLVLVAHLSLVAICMSGNGPIRSELHGRLLNATRLYTRMLNLDPDQTPYYLTYGGFGDVDHRIELLPEGADPAKAESWVVLPDAGWRGGDRYKRYQRLGRIAASFSEFGDDAAVAAIAVDVGRNHHVSRETKPVEFRVRRHALQAWEAIERGTPDQRDPNSREYFRTVYDADLIVTPDGSVFPNKRADDSVETAKVGSGGEGNADGDARDSGGQP